MIGRIALVFIAVTLMASPALANDRKVIRDQYGRQVGGCPGLC